MSIADRASRRPCVYEHRSSWLPPAPERDTARDADLPRSRPQRPSRRARRHRGIGWATSAGSDLALASAHSAARPAQLVSSRRVDDASSRPVEQSRTKAVSRVRRAGALIENRPPSLGLDARRAPIGRLLDSVRVSRSRSSASTVAGRRAAAILRVRSIDLCARSSTSGLRHRAQLAGKRGQLASGNRSCAPGHPRARRTGRARSRAASAGSSGS